jgi:hypothetical protein
MIKYQRDALGIEDSKRPVPTAVRGDREIELYDHVRPAHDNLARPDDAPAGGSRQYLLDRRRAHGASA